SVLLNVPVASAAISFVAVVADANDHWLLAALFATLGAMFVALAVGLHGSGRQHARTYESRARMNSGPWVRATTNGIAVGGLVCLAAFALVLGSQQGCVSQCVSP